MGCQKSIAAKVIENGADYVLAVKMNQRTIHDNIKLYFESEKAALETTTLEKNHGRVEKREYFIETDISWLPERNDWTGLNAIGRVSVKRKMYKAAMDNSALDIIFV